MGGGGGGGGGGWVGGWVEIIRIKAVLSSTRLELELELSLAIYNQHNHYSIKIMQRCVSESVLIFSMIV